METITFSDRLIERLAAATHVAVLTGAGISAESGIPTFRDPGGLWERFRPEELANIQAFLKNPALVQGWYAHRREIASQAQPNAGHLALVELESLSTRFTLITQNVDNLHQRAGNRQVVELHGNITHTYCIDCCREVTEAEMTAFEKGEAARCNACSGYIRPDVVWFGEMLPHGAFEAAQQAAQRADVFFSIGTSAIVYPAAGLPRIARQHGAYTAEINVQPSAIAGEMDEVILGKGGITLPLLVAALRAHRS